MLSKKSQSGFTIVELLVATSVFSLVMLGAAATILQVTRLYYKGIISSRTQTDARNLLENISRPIQLERQTIFGPKSVSTTSTGSYPVNVMCIGNTRFTYVVGLEKDESVQIDESKTKIAHAIWKNQVDNPQQCETNVPNLTDSNLSNGVDMLGQHMRLSKFEVDENSSVPGLWNINIDVLYGDRDLMLPQQSPASFVMPASCNGAVAGSQWCAKASYSTKVYKRVTNTP